MAGSTFTPYSFTPEGVTIPFVVCLFDRESGEYTYMPNIRVEGFQRVKGAVPHTAQFSYALDNTLPLDQRVFPSDFADIFNPIPNTPYVVEEDDEICIFAVMPSGDMIGVFHGFADLPEFNAAEGMEVTFVAQSAHKRLWDTVIEGSHWRDADKPDSELEDDVVWIEEPAWFNPKAKPNKTPDAHNVLEGEAGAYPVFLDPRLPGSPAKQDYWTLPDLVTYLVRKYNADEKWVDNPVDPKGSDFADFLVAVTPKSGQYFDLEDTTTFTTAPIVIRSLDASNRPFIEVIDEQLQYYGFEMFFTTEFDPTEAPKNGIVFFRLDGLDGAKAKEFFWPFDGTLTDEVPDINALSLAKDGVKPANEFRIETGPEEIEITVNLAPLFKIDPADASTGNIPNFDRAKVMDQPIATRSKYRWYGLDEAGIGHWDYKTNAWVEGDPFDFDEVFGSPSVPPGGGPRERQYAHRLRTLASELFSKDDGGNVRKAKLEISRDFTGTVPSLRDPDEKTSTWRSLSDSCWKFLPDRAGIEITCDNPESWRLPKNDGSQAPGDLIRGITSQANPGTDDNSARFYLRLTCKVKADRGIQATAYKREAAPTEFTVRRSIDAKDHFKKQTVHQSSVYSTAQKPVSPTDDSAKAQAAADALRASREMPPLAGAARVPWISFAFGVGDLISKIDGRDLDLYDNAGVNSGESKRYPSIIGVSFTCQEPQTTIFKLTDRRAEPQKV